MGRYRTLSTEEFIERSAVVHKGKYDYQYTIYTRSIDKVVIVCPEHGAFQQSANNHLNTGCGCPTCGQISKGVKIINQTKVRFMKNMEEIFGELYTFNIDTYKGINEPISFICPEHGDVVRKPTSLLKGYGCPLCIFRKSWNQENFIEAGKEIHGDRYDYKLVKFRGFGKPIIILCPEHGAISQYPENHLRGRVCRKCWQEGLVARKKKDRI